MIGGGVSAMDFMAAGVRLTEAVEGLDDEICKPLTRLADSYRRRAWAMMSKAPGQGAAATATLSEIDEG